MSRDGWTIEFGTKIFNATVIGADFNGANDGGTSSTTANSTSELIIQAN